MSVVEIIARVTGHERPAPPITVFCVKLFLPRSRSLQMTKQEKKRLSSVLRATEYLFLENIALKLVLEHREVPNWQKLLNHLLADKEMLAGVRLKFRDVYNEIEGSADPSGALDTLLGELPTSKKPH